jgi:hypothetical protein
MEKTKLTIRVSKDLLANFKQYAQAQNTTMTSLLEAYLLRVPSQEPLTNAPIVRRLSGSLSKDVGIEDYKNHLAEKYGS